MSQTATHVKNFWMFLAISFIILTVAFAATTGLALSALSAANNDKANLAGQVSALNNKLVAYNQTINSLSQQISTLNSQVSGLQSQVSSLQDQLKKLEASNVVAVFQDTLTAPICILGICITDGHGTLTAVAWANLGTMPANNAILTVTFYDASGNSLCSVVQQLGPVPGQSIKALDSLTNSCDTGTKTPVSALGSLTWS